MFIIIGIVVVFGSIVAGYLMEHGNLRVLLQPAELIIIGGAAIGTLLIANPLHVVKKIAGGVVGALKGSHINQAFYLETLKMCYEILNKARKNGLLAIESDIEEPEKSEVFTKYPHFLKDHHTRDFVCDTLRMAVTGGIDPFDLDQMMDLDMEVSHRGDNAPVSALSTVADSLPGLGHCGRSTWSRDHHGRAWEGLRKRLGARWRRPWWGRFWAFCFATGWSGRWRRTWRSRQRTNMPTCMCCGWC